MFLTCHHWRHWSNFNGTCKKFIADALCCFTFSLSYNKLGEKSGDTMLLLLRRFPSLKSVT